jgi:hypothetical protein
VHERIVSAYHVHDGNHKISLLQVYHAAPSAHTWYERSAAINQAYARRHGYGYVFVVAAGVPSPREGRNRTLQWARVPILLWLLRNFPDGPDWWFHLDMDAMVNPRFMHLPLDWALDAKCVIRQSPSSTADLVYFSNAPQEPHMPCAGLFFASRNATRSLELWWRFDTDPYFDTHSEHDQHVVHELMYFLPDQFRFRVLDVRPFNNRLDSSWFLHYAGASRVSEQALRDRIAVSLWKAGVSVPPLEQQQMLNCSLGRYTHCVPLDLIQ